MNRYLELIRIENEVIGLTGFIVSTFIASGDVCTHWSAIILGCAIVVLFIAGGNSLNDYVDREVDKVAHPNRPLPSKRISPGIALNLGVGCLIFSCVLSVFQRNIVSIFIVIIAVTIIVLYEIFLKKRGFVGNIAIAILTGMLFLLGGSVVDNIGSVFEIAGMAMVATVGREITKDIEDMRGDEGRQTLPMLIGRKNAGSVVTLFYVTGIILSMVPMVVGSLGNMYLTVLVADIIFMCAAVTSARDPYRSQRLAKVAMAMALVAFLLGVIHDVN